MNLRNAVAQVNEDRFITIIIKVQLTNLEFSQFQRDVFLLAEVHYGPRQVGMANEEMAIKCEFSCLEPVERLQALTYSSRNVKICR